MGRTKNTFTVSFLDAVNSTDMALLRCSTVALKHCTNLLLLFEDKRQVIESIQIHQEQISEQLRRSQILFFRPILFRSLLRSVSCSVSPTRSRSTTTTTTTTTTATGTTWVAMIFRCCVRSNKTHAKRRS